MQQAASARLYRRLQAVLLAGEGASATRIAAVTGASVRSVHGWCATWRRSKERRQPQKALAEKPRLGRHPVVPALDRARLLAELAKDPLALGYAASNWTVPLLATHLRQRCRLPIKPPTPCAVVCGRQVCAGSVRVLSLPNPPRTSPRKKGARARAEDPACRWPPAGPGRNDAAPPAALASGVGVARKTSRGTHQRQERPAFSFRHHRPAHGPAGGHGAAPATPGRLPRFFAPATPRGSEPAERSGFCSTDTAATAIPAACAWLPS